MSVVYAGNSKRMAKAAVRQVLRCDRKTANMALSTAKTLRKHIAEGEFPALHGRCRISHSYNWTQEDWIVESVK
jgi:hypothetical protein